LKEGKNTPPDTPVLPEPTPVEQTPVIEEAATEQPVSTELSTEAEPSAEQVDEALPNLEQVAQAEQDIPQQSIEVSAPLPKSNSRANKRAGDCAWPRTYR
jgi:hypothetical protein